MTEATKKSLWEERHINCGALRVQPQWPPVTTVGSTSASASALFPSLLLHPLHIQKLGTGSLMADSTQEILQGSVA